MKSSSTSFLSSMVFMVAATSSVRKHAAHGVEELGLLILAEVGAAEAGKIGLALFDDGGGVFFARLDAHEDLFLLFAIEGGVELIEEKSLIPEGIALVILGLAKCL